MQVYCHDVNCDFLLWIKCAEQHQAEIDSLKAQLLLVQADTKRVDFLADKNQLIANVQLPREIVERNLSSLRDAIDEIVALAEQEQNND